MKTYFAVYIMNDSQWIWWGFLFIQLQRRHEQMKKNLEAQHKELEEKRRQFEEEKVSWEAQQRMLEQQKLDASRYTQFFTKLVSFKELNI